MTVRTDQRPHWDIADVLARTDLAALLDTYAEPAGTARGKRWHCPVSDHDDSNASVTMHTDGRGHERWRCWSGDNSHRGDAIDLVMVAQRVDRVTPSTTSPATPASAQMSRSLPRRPASRRTGRLDRGRSTPPSWHT